MLLLIGFNWLLFLGAVFSWSWGVAGIAFDLLVIWALAAATRFAVIGIGSALLLTAVLALVAAASLVVPGRLTQKTGKIIFSVSDVVIGGGAFCLVVGMLLGPAWGLFLAAAIGAVAGRPRIARRLMVSTVLSRTGIRVWGVLSANLVAQCMVLVTGGSLFG